MSQFLHNPALILTDSIKPPNLQLSIWPYQLHSSFVLTFSFTLSLLSCPMPFPPPLDSKHNLPYLSLSHLPFSRQATRLFSGLLLNSRSILGYPRSFCHILLVAQVKCDPCFIDFLVKINETRFWP